MTTIVTIAPCGHNCEAVITTTHPGQDVTQEIHKLNPHMVSTFNVYGGRTITVRETEGWAPAPDLDETP